MNIRGCLFFFTEKIKFESLVMEITNEQLGLGFGLKKIGGEMRFTPVSGSP